MSGAGKLQSATSVASMRERDELVRRAGLLAKQLEAEAGMNDDIVDGPLTTTVYRTSGSSWARSAQSRTLKHAAQDTKLAASIGLPPHAPPLPTPSRHVEPVLAAAVSHSARTPSSPTSSAPLSSSATSARTPASPGAPTRTPASPGALARAPASPVTPARTPASPVQPGAGDGRSGDTTEPAKAARAGNGAQLPAHLSRRVQSSPLLRLAHVNLKLKAQLARQHLEEKKRAQVAESRQQALSRALIILASQLRSASIAPACNAAVLRAVESAAGALPPAGTEDGEARLFSSEAATRPSRDARQEQPHPSARPQPQVPTERDGEPPELASPTRQSSAAVALAAAEAVMAMPSPATSGDSSTDYSGSPPAERLSNGHAPNDRHAAPTGDAATTTSNGASAVSTLGQDGTDGGNRVGSMAAASGNDANAAAASSDVSAGVASTAATAQSNGNSSDTKENVAASVRNHAPLSAAISIGDDDVDAVVVDTLRKAGRGAQVAIDLWRVRGTSGDDDGRPQGPAVRVTDSLPSHLAAQRNGHAAKLVKQRLRVKVRVVNGVPCVPQQDGSYMSLPAYLAQQVPTLGPRYGATSHTSAASSQPQDTPAPPAASQRNR